jgi:hypothetical protein
LLSAQVILTSCKSELTFDYLEECTGLSLSLIETEAITGDFAVDILAEDANGNLVVIKNQLDRTDHDHLGKLITYMANHEAKAAIWVTAQPRPEHERAIDWLNEMLPADTAFYLVRVEAIQIDQLRPRTSLHGGRRAESRGSSDRRSTQSAGRATRLAVGVLAGVAGEGAQAICALRKHLPVKRSLD